ncbi:glutaredoxin domain-containing protein [Terrabacter carboxydivorans]|uniref:Glutaredoxin domain-containing protein n=1 Tax=Terrabacter carboxydivorans TaxID=619730 RepID=A0ABN3MIQ8_9MICO
MTIEVLWRPGCPFCARLRRRLAMEGVQTIEHDIWSDPLAAARVREVTGGDETVPTVFVWQQALVNPSLEQVMAAAGLAPDGQQGRGGGVVGRGIAWTLGMALLWLGLALWRPTTTWHLAPVLVAGALPWFVISNLSSVRRKTRAVLLAAAAGGIAAALAATVMSGLDLLRGPTLRHPDGAALEALQLSGGTALATVLAGLFFAIRSGGSDATTP